MHDTAVAPSAAAPSSSSAARRMVGVIIGWLLSVPVLLSFGFYAWSATQADLREVTGPWIVGAVVVFAVHLIGLAVQSALLLRARASSKTVWLACLCASLLFCALATGRGVATVPGFGLTGIFAWPHWAFAAILFILNRPTSLRSGA